MYTTLSIDTVARTNGARTNGTRTHAAQTAAMAAEACLGTGTRPERQARALGEIETVPAGGRIYRQDDPAHALYHTIAGTVCTSLVLENGHRRVTGFLSEGDYFGSIFSERYRCAAEAITDCTLVRYNRLNRTPGHAGDPFQSQIVLEALQSERRIAEEHVLLLGGVTACAKVAAFLLYLSKRAARRGEPENPVSIPMTRYDIADFLGTTPESVSRCLTKLNRSGVIRMETPDTIALVDRRMLSDIPRGF